MNVDRVICSRAEDFMLSLPPACVDLTVTSPPYDQLRKYRGFMFNPRLIIQGLWYVTKPGGVVVWVVGDEVVNGSESGTSFRHALMFLEEGFSLWDTMIYAKTGSGYPERRRYTQLFEYMYVFVRPQLARRADYPPLFDPPLAAEEAAWLAAMIDGEGCFSLAPRGDGNFQAKIVIVNSDKRLLDHCSTITRTGHSTVHRDDDPNHRDWYHWVVGSWDAVRIISAVYPYLISKKEQAKVLLAYQQRVHPTPGGTRIAEDELRRRGELAMLMKALNQRECTSSGFPEPDLRTARTTQPKTVNLIRDVPKLWAGSWGTTTQRQRDGKLRKSAHESCGKGRSGRATDGRYGYKARGNIWTYCNAKGFAHTDKLAYKHPATFPEQLATDHILSWTDPGDLVFDPMAGSGTTLKMARKHDRHYLGTDMSEEYCALAEERVALAGGSK